MKTNEIVLSSQIESTISFGFNISALQEQRTDAEDRPKKGRLQNCRIFALIRGNARSSSERSGASVKWTSETGERRQRKIK